MQKIKNSYQLAKLSLSIISNDSRLVWVQVMGLIVSLTFAVFFYYALYRAGYLEEYFVEESTNSPMLISLILAVFYLTLITIYHLTEAMSIHLTLGQVRNERKTISSALDSIKNNIVGILQFSGISATVGVVLNTLEDRLPWFGAIAAAITQGAWNIATPFAIPHLIEGDATGGIDATRKSVSTFKNAFGENMLVRGGVGAFMTLVILLWIAVFILCLPILATIYLNGLAVIFSLGFGALGLVAIILGYATMNSVLTALLYEFAKNGKSLTTIDKEVFKSMLTPKKARSVFSN